MPGSFVPLGHAAAAVAGLFVLSVVLAQPASSGRPSPGPAPVDLGIAINPGQVGAVPGAYVVGVRAGTAAAEAGLRAGDLVIAADGERLSGPAALPRRLRRHRPGDAVPLEVLRDGRLLGASLRVPPVEEGSSAPSVAPRAVAGTRRTPHAAAPRHAGRPADANGAHPRYVVGGMGVGYRAP